MSATALLLLVRGMIHWIITNSKHANLIVLASFCHLMMMMVCPHLLCMSARVISRELSILLWLRTIQNYWLIQPSSRKCLKTKIWYSLMKAKHSSVFTFSHCIFYSFLIQLLVNDHFIIMFLSLVMLLIMKHVNHACFPSYKCMSYVLHIMNMRCLI